MSGSATGWLLTATAGHALSATAPTVMSGFGVWLSTGISRISLVVAGSAAVGGVMCPALSVGTIKDRTSLRTVTCDRSGPNGNSPGRVTGPKEYRPDALPVGDGAWPHYYSTSCLHGLHSRCRKECKFCEERCRCDCHREEVVMLS